MDSKIALDILKDVYVYLDNKVQATNENGILLGRLQWIMNELEENAKKRLEEEK